MLATDRHAVRAAGRVRGRAPTLGLVPVAAGPAAIIRLEAMIDARIDKALARLVSLQEYERVTATYSPPLIPV
jgi:hypothetical protein